MGNSKSQIPNLKQIQKEEIQNSKRPEPGMGVSVIGFLDFGFV